MLTSENLKTKNQKARILLILTFVLALPQTLLLFRYLFFISDNTSQNDTLVFLIFPTLYRILQVGVLLLALRIFPQQVSLKLCWTGKPRTKLRWYFLLILLTVTFSISIGVISKVTGISSARYIAFNDVTVLTHIFFILYAAGIVVTAPIVEEIFWRGYAQDQLTKVFGGKITIILQAFLFALFHWYLPLGFILVFVHALIFGIWRYKRRTLVPIILAHMAWNGLWALAHIPDQYEMSKKNIAINYVDELNKIGNADISEDNAAPYYKQACDFLIAPTEHLDFLKQTVWIEECTSEQKQALKHWIELNQKTLSYLKQGALKKTYWPDYIGKSMMEIGFSQNYGEIKHLSKALCWNAQILASEGKTKIAFDELVACYRLGQHMASPPKPFISQLVGFGIKSQICHTYLVIIDNCNLMTEELELLRIQLDSLFTSNPITIDFTAEHLTIMDTIQRLFTDDNSGNGYLPQLEKIDVNSTMIKVMYPDLTEETAEKTNQSTRKETVEITNNLFETLEYIMSKSPFELHKENIDINQLVQSIAGENIVSLYMSGISSQHIVFYSTVARENALEVILALFQYKIIHNEFPESLSGLISEGLLSSLPVDPYSSESFKYIKAGETFKLYSPGRDFEDNGGDYKNDLVFWPIQYDMK